MATKPSILTTIAEEKSAAGVQNMTRQSFAWLRQKMLQLRNPTAYIPPMTREMFRYTPPSNRQKFLLGGLYFFIYDPKTKVELPYYDRFPLVMPLQRQSDGFLGLNLHYLPVNYRILFMRKLMGRAIYDENDEIKRIRITYDILDATRRLREFRPCVKQYLYSHIRSRILAVQPDEWDVATYLPVHQFKKQAAKSVWQDSIEEIRNS
jgi:hypothetical protein